MASRSTAGARPYDNLDVFVLRCVDGLGREGDASIENVGHAIRPFEADPVTRTTVLIARGWLTWCGGHLSLTEAGEFVVQLDDNNTERA